VAGEYKPWLDKKISDWSGAKSAGDLSSEDAPKPAPFPAAREVFAPARKYTETPTQGQVPKAVASPTKRGSRVNYKIPE